MTGLLLHNKMVNSVAPGDAVPPYSSYIGCIFKIGSFSCLLQLVAGMPAVPCVPDCQPRRVTASANSRFRVKEEAGRMPELLKDCEQAQPSRGTI
jgi:hypothetical protein